ncbi:MAG: HupE/UreJ family protein, partial [Cyanobacteria bacterium P01_G01_bin.38]
MKLIAMMNDLIPNNLNRRMRKIPTVKIGNIFSVVPLVCLAVFILSTPAFAHHPFGGSTPSSFVDGFLSGLGHPVIGPDHLVFTIVVGLLATRLKPQWAMPAAFLAAALAGTGMHLMALNMPAPELFISLSILIFGGLAVYGRSLNTALVVLLAAIASLFHGYAYGEAIVGAEITPLLSYLIGFTAVQGAIMAGAFAIVQRRTPTQRSAWLRYAGLV